MSHNIYWLLNLFDSGNVVASGWYANITMGHHVFNNQFKLISGNLIFF